MLAHTLDIDSSFTEDKSHCQREHCSAEYCGGWWLELCMHACKKTEEALRQAEERYKELTESISDIFFAMNKNLRYTYWNKASEKLTGISAKDAIGKSLTEIFPDAKGTKVEEMYLETLRTQRPRSSVNKYYLGGKDFVFEINAYPTKDGISVFAKDITERKRMEEAMRENREMLNNIFAASPDAITVTDLSGNIVECNQATLDLHRCSSKEDLIGRNALDFIAEKDHSMAMKNLKKALEQGLVRNIEYTFLTKDGNEFPAELSASVIRDSSWNPTGFVAITK
jgi:PAS domain S-box-containing protein